MSDELPQGWATARISELCDVPKEKGREGVVPYLEIGNVDIGSKNYTLTDKPSVKGCRVAKKNDVLVSKVRPTRGAIIQIREDEIQVSSAFTVLRDRGTLTEKCLWHFLAWNRAYLNYLGENCTGTMYPTTSDDVITDFEMPIAPLAEQRRIVAKLEKLLGQVDACQQRLEKMPKLLKRFRQSILAAACSGRLTADWRNENKQRESFSERCEQIRITRTEQLAQATEDAERRGQNKPKMESLDTTVSFSDYDLPEIPDEWGWIHIGYVAWVKGGKRLPAGQKLSESDTGQPYIRAANLKGGTVVTDDIQYVPEHLKQKIRNYTVKANDVYITIVGACIGDAGVIPEKMDGANLTENAAKITGLVGCTSVFMANWLRSPIAQQLIQTNILSAAQGKLALFRIEQLPLPLPPLAEQQEIVRRVAGLFALADQLEQRLAQARKQVDKLTPSLLARAFAGQLVPQNPADEPAEKLLERIKAKP